jgi:hypothetical protein
LLRSTHQPQGKGRGKDEKSLSELKIKNEELRMKGVRGGKYLSKLSERFPEFQSRLFENQ